MTWLTWRQFRVSAIAAAIALAACAILLALTTHDSELAHCVGRAGCPVTGGKFLGLAHDHLLQYLSTALVAAPALLGAFWGAPLVARELESGTHRLAWTQSVTRGRWFAVKVGVTGLAVTVGCGLFSLMLGWWSSAEVNRGRISPAMFAERGIAPIGYAAFALAVGIAAGLLIRRTVPAMAATLVVFIGARMAVQFWLRQHLVALVHGTTALGNGLGIARTPSGIQLFTPPPEIPGAWVISSRLVDSTGHGPTTAFVNSACGHLGPPPPLASGHHAVVRAAGQHGFQQCIGQVAAKFHEVVAYQPASHYWALQGAETGLFLVVALALVGGSFWWVRHRLT